MIEMSSNEEINFLHVWTVGCNCSGASWERIHTYGLREFIPGMSKFNADQWHTLTAEWNFSSTHKYINFTGIHDWFASVTNSHRSRYYPFSSYLSLFNGFGRNIRRRVCVIRYPVTFLGRQNIMNLFSMKNGFRRFLRYPGEQKFSCSCNVKH